MAQPDYQPYLIKDHKVICTTRSSIFGVPKVQPRRYVILKSCECVFSHLFRTYGIIY